jgi:hypothetical protein
MLLIEYGLDLAEEWKHSKIILRYS